MIPTMILLFVVGYLFIALEHKTRIDKSAVALLMAGAIWTVFSLLGNDPHIQHELVDQLGDTCEILVFLIGAMTIVDLIDSYGGFNVITDHITTRNKRKLMWLLAIITFFMSAALDNMTTTIIMVMLLRRLIANKKERWIFASVIVIAATNRADILDHALLRPGRFDRQVFVGLPDIKGREEILKIHAKGKPLAEDVDLGSVARATSGFTGADLENLLNEAAIMAAKDRRRFVRQSDIKSAFIKVGIGAEKRSKVISDKEKRITAYHETGHAILFHVLPHMDPVYTISIIPTGMGAAGYTMPLPDNDEMFNTKNKMLEDITTLLGGRVAEEIIFGDITTGASNDIKRATETARSMVMKYGMSEKIGLIAYGNDDDEVFIGRDLAHTRGYSEEVAREIDGEISRIIRECHENAESIIRENIGVLHSCAALLLEKEKIHREEFEALFTTEKGKVAKTNE